MAWLWRVVALLCRGISWCTMPWRGLGYCAVECHIMHRDAMAVVGHGVSWHCMIVAYSGMSCLGRSWRSILCCAEARHAIQWCACAVSCFDLA